MLIAGKQTTAMDKEFPMSITSNHISDRVSLGAMIVSAASSVFNGLVYLAENSSRAKELDRLQQMSDEQLAVRKLSRDTLYDHVFRSTGHL